MLFRSTIPLDAAGHPQHELGSVAQDFSGEVRQFTVECATIDSDHLENVGFIKIDVEQHEREVLHGALNTIERCRPVLLIEVYPLKYENPLPDEFSFILKMNYVAWFSFAGKWYPFEQFDSNIHAVPGHFGDSKRFMGNNIVFFPAEHPLAKAGPV